MSTFGLIWNLKSPDRNKQFISNILRMSRIWEVYLWRKNIRNNSENCYIVGIVQSMMALILLKCCYQFGFLKLLAQQLCSEHFPTLPEVLIIWTGSGLTVKRKRCMLVQKGYYCSEWKVNNGKIEVIPLVVMPSSKLSIVNVEITIQVWGGGCSLRCFLYFTWIDEFQILCKFCVFQR